MSASAAGGERLKVLELYCGIGGCAAALDGTSARITAVDINRIALGVYTHNFDHRAIPSLVESLSVDQLQRWGADLWWMSPPCQPFTRRGKQRDLDDPRAATLLAVLGLVSQVRPRYLAFENVPAFEGSHGHALLRATLDQAGYRSIREAMLCPSVFGVPNRRKRYYLVAAHDDLLPLPDPVRQLTALRRYLDAEPSQKVGVDPRLVERYRDALHVVRADDPDAMTACFTSAYGRSPVRSGSYLATDTSCRRFSPCEILRLLGFPASYRLPVDLPLGNAWRLVGGSLSIVTVRAILATIPELESLTSEAT